MEAAFYLSGAIAIAATLMVITGPSAVHALLYLIISLLAIAIVFFVLGAPFVAALEVIIYAGAVMVLFLFIIMLLDLKAESRRRVNLPALCGGFVVIILFVKVLSDVSYGFEGGNAKFQAISQGPQGDVWHVGMVLFQQYNIALQVVGTLILVASIGVVILSKRELK